MFSSANLKMIVNVVSQEIVTILPCRCPEGCAIMLIQLDNWDPESFALKDFKRGGMILLSQAIREPLTQITGFKVIVDVRSNPLKHLKYCTFSNLYQLYHGTQETSSGRFKSIHVLNNSVTFKTGWSMMKPFLPEKIKNRAHFHPSPEELFQFFPRAVIPTKYGGYLQNYDMTDWFRRATEYDEVAVLLGLPPKPNRLHS
ncbi:alpha-tocopherol transfer protein-like [Uloborus diversus]|uniref:alpha-tocopherol transfer protein-like n=1 Tax=Uloborus diversus TaxID=327109 RepID=UPI00240A53C8|nr:alpha-tocopherol transfer protein-like [Uloborus diversus]